MLSGSWIGTFESFKSSEGSKSSCNCNCTDSALHQVVLEKEQNNEKSCYLRYIMYYLHIRIIMNHWCDTSIMSELRCISSGAQYESKVNCRINNIPAEILIACRDLIPDIGWWWTSLKPLVQIIKMRLINRPIYNTHEMVVSASIRLKDMFNLKTTVEALGYIL